jgi:hypothetical protein
MWWCASKCGAGSGSRSSTGCGHVYAQPINDERKKKASLMHDSDATLGYCKVTARAI